MKNQIQIRKDREIKEIKQALEFWKKFQSESDKMVSSCIVNHIPNPTPGKVFSWMCEHS